MIRVGTWAIVRNVKYMQPSGDSWRTAKISKVNISIGSLEDDDLRSKDDCRGNSVAGQAD